MTEIVRDLDRPDLGGNVRHGDSATFCPSLWGYFIDRFAIKSFLDVGCGEGHAVAFFHKRGVFAHGIDGLLANVMRSVVPISQHDLCLYPYRMPVDLVWSCEVAEHIPEVSVETYIDTLTNGTVIAMTHATPGQVGHHHVNCQPSEYWIEKLEKRGYILDRCNDQYKTHHRDKWFTYFSFTGLVFLRK